MAISSRHILAERFQTNIAGIFSLSERNPKSTYISNVTSAEEEPCNVEMLANGEVRFADFGGVSVVEIT